MSFSPSGSEDWKKVWLRFLQEVYLKSAFIQIMVIWLSSGKGIELVKTMQVCLQACADITNFNNKTPNILEFCDRSIVAFSHNFQLTQLTTSSFLASIFLLTATTSPMVSPERIIYWNSNSWRSPLLSNFCKLITTSQGFWQVIGKFLLINQPVFIWQR